jgi:hypothetical protein
MFHIWHINTPQCRIEAVIEMPRPVTAPPTDQTLPIAKVIFQSSLKKNKGKTNPNIAPKIIKIISPS